MDAAASRRAKPNRGRPLVPPNYVSLRDLQELRLREKEEQRRREEEEAAARRVREEQRKRQVEEEAAARRIVEERRRREEEAAARRARDAAAAPKAEMRASFSSQNSSSSFRYNERARGGQRLVVVADRPPRAAGKIDGATEGCLGKKWPDGGAPNAHLRGGFKAQHVGRGKVSAGVLAGPGEPDKPATASSHAGKPEEKRNGEASGCQGKASGASSASSELAKVDIASCRGPARLRNRHQGKKGFDGRSTETAITRSIGEPVEASPLPIVNVENKGKSRSGDRITETALASIPGKVAEASPPRGVKSDNKGKKNPLRCRQAGAAPSSDLPDEKKVESSGSEGTASVVSSAPGEQADAESASYGMRLRPMYRRKGKNGSHVWSTETATTIVAGKAADASPPEGVIKGLIEQSTETALASEVTDASLARGFKPENKGKKESSGGRHTGMAPSINCPDGMKPQPCPAAVGSDTQKSSGCQGTTWAAKTEGLQGKLTVVEVKAQPHLAAESGSYLKSSGDQGMIQVAESESSKEKQRVVDMRTTAQLKPWDMRNSGRQRPGGHSRVNIAPRQHDMVWVPKAASVADSAEVGKFP